MVTQKFLPLLALSSLAAFSQLGMSQEAPNPSQVYIKTIGAMGTGCKQGTFATNLSDDRKAFTVNFSDFIAYMAPGASIAEARKNCSITLTLNVPAGWQYSVGSFNYRGYMDVAPKVLAEHSTSYFFQGTGQTGSFVAREQGPITKDFVYTDRIGLTSVYIPDTWSPCNVERALTINPSIRLTKQAGYDQNSESIITNDSADGEITQVFGLSWRKCGQTSTPRPDPQPNPNPGDSGSHGPDPIIPTPTPETPKLPAGCDAPAWVEWHPYKIGDKVVFENQVFTARNENNPGYHPKNSWYFWEPGPMCDGSEGTQSGSVGEQPTTPSQPETPIITQPAGCDAAPWVQNQWYPIGAKVVFEGQVFTARNEPNPGYHPKISWWFWEPGPMCN